VASHIAVLSRSGGLSDSVLQTAYVTLAGGWAAAWGHCDDRVILERTERRLLAVVADATSPTYGGYFMPLGMDIGLAALQGELRAHDHVCSMPCLVGALGAAHRVMCDLERAIEAEREKMTGLEDALLRSARAGGRAAEPFGFHGDRLVHTGASVSACLFAGTKMHVAQIGSCRVYRRRGRRGEPLLRDHTLNTQLSAAGQEPDPAHQSVVTRILGFPAHVEPEFATFDVEPGDAFFLCSDGVWVGHPALVERALAASTPQGMVGLITAELKQPLRDDAAVIAVGA